MSRLNYLSRLLLVALATGGAASRAPAQGVHLPENSTDPLDELKQAAQARYARQTAAPAELARARLETAREGHDAQRRILEMGKGNLEIVREWERALAEAQRALDEPDATAGLAERAWERAWLYERVVTERLQNGRADRCAWFESRAVRLEGEIRWAEARTGRGKRSGGPLFGPLFLEEEALVIPLARAKFDATQADLGELRRARLAALRGERDEYWRILETGKGQPDNAVGPALLGLGAELALLGPDADPTPALLRAWGPAWTAERNGEDRYLVGRIAQEDFLALRLLRLDLELALARARSARKRPARPDARLFDPRQLDDDLLDTAQARARFQAAQATPEDLARTRRDVALEAYRAMERVYREGKGTTDGCLAAAERLAEAEQALLGEKASSVPLLERRWERALFAEQLALDRHRSGRVGYDEVLAARYNRLTIEWQLAQVRRGTK
jgi:hypothetical protein